MKSEINEVSTQDTDIQDADIQDADIQVTTPEESDPNTQQTEVDSAAAEKAATATDAAPASPASAPSTPNGSEPKAESESATAQTVAGTVLTEEGTPDQQTEAAAAPDEDAAGEAAGEESAGEESAEEESAEQKRIAELEEKLATAESRAEEMFERLQRTTAEFQNSQRRREKQVREQTDRANARLVERLLPVLDDFELAFRNMPEEFSPEDNSWVAGLQQIDKKLRRILEDEGVTRMEPTGEFDPNRHEAVSSEPNEDVESGHIIETLRTGYDYKGRVLRPALVRVAL